MSKVVKFGGSSLADAKQFRKVADIIHADPERKYVVPSAPGKRFKEDTKVTDMLYRCYDEVAVQGSSDLRTGQGFHRSLRTHQGALQRHYF